MAFVKALLVSAAALATSAFAEGATTTAATVAAAAPTCSGGAGVEECVVEAEGGDEVSQLQLAAGRRSQERPAEAEPDLADIMKDLANPLPEWPAGVNKMRRACRMENDGTGCSIPDMFSGRLGSKDEFVSVYPGGETKCIGGGDYWFTLRMGDPDKLHIHFQGGGACWDLTSYNLGLCFTNVDEEPPLGAFNVSNPANPWKDYSFIIINYCSGDMHSGNADRPWGSGYSQVKIRGYENANSALQWGLDAFSSLSKLTISGSSAGSLGVQVWSRKVLEMYAPRSEDVFVIGDSFIGVLYPPDAIYPSESYLEQAWNMCNAGFLTTEQLEECNKGNLLLLDVWLETMEKYPHVRFATSNSKADATQINFEKGFEATARHSIAGAMMTTGEFYKTASLDLKKLFEKQSNFHTYLVQSDAHTYLPYSYMYTATPGGTAGGDGLRPTLLEWLAELVDPSSASDAAATLMRTVCAGTPKDLTEATKVGSNETEYCARALSAVAS